MSASPSVVPSSVTVPPGTGAVHPPGSGEPTLPLAPEPVPESGAGNEHRRPAFVPMWQRHDEAEPPSGSPTGRRRRVALVLIALSVAAGLVGVGLVGVVLRRAGDTSESTTAAKATKAATASTTEATTSSAAGTSSIAPVDALEPLAASVRVLAGGPDAMGNGGGAERALLRRPTAVVRVGVGLVIADAGGLRLVRPDGRIEGVEVDDLAQNFRIDHLAALSSGRLLAVDESTDRFAVIDGIGTSSVSATAAALDGIVSPVDVVGDGRGGAIIADPGSGSVWRWEPNAKPMRLLGSLLAPVHVAALDGGGALVTDRGTGLILRIDAPNQATVIAADPAIASRVAGAPVVLRSTPIAAVADNDGGVQVLMADGAISRVPLRPLINDRAALLAEFLAGATSLAADDGATLVVASGERRIQRLVVSEPGPATLSTVIGDAPWPRVDLDVLQATDVMLIDPTGIAVRPDGTVVVVDRGTNVIWELDEDGSAKRLAGTGTWGTSADNPDALASAIASPTEVAVRGDGTVVFTEPTFGRIRAVLTDGSLVTLAGPTIAEPDLTLFSPGPLALDGQGALLSGDRFAGGMWSITESGVRPVPGAAPPTRFAFAAAERNGAVVAMDAFGKAVRIEGGAVSGGAQRLVSPDEIVVSGTSDGSDVIVAVASDRTERGRTPQRSDAFSVIRRSAFDRTRSAHIAAMAARNGSVFLATSGLRGAVSETDGAGDLPLTSTSLGDDGGRANETALSDPVALDAVDDGTLIVTDRGGGRIRSLRAGQFATLAGNGGVTTRNDARANAFEQSLADLRDAHVGDDGTVTVIDGSRLLAVDGTGLVNERVVRDPAGDIVSLRSIDEDSDGTMLGVTDDGRLLRIGDAGSTILTTEPALAKVRVQTNNAVWGVTNSGRVVRLVGGRFVEVETPRDLAVIASDERDGRLAVVGRDGAVAVRIAGRWFRLSPSTTVTPDRRTNRPAAPRPTDIAVLPDGAIVVADAGRDSLLVYRES